MKKMIISAFALLAGGAAFAEVPEACKITIEGDDAMKFNVASVSLAQRFR